MIPRFAWPDGKKCALMLGIAFDDGLDATARAPELPTREKSFSVWQYGAERGVARILDCLAEAGILATWFIPGSLAGSRAEHIRRIAAAGHEIACHGWGAERPDSLAPADRRALLSRAREALQSASGQGVTGFRLPFGNWPATFADELREAGFDWSHSLCGDDWPYLHQNGLVEIPAHSETEDRGYFQFNFSPAFPVGQSRIPSYEGVLANWIAEFDACRQYGLTLSMLFRPEWTGTPGRIGLMRRFLGHVLSHRDVWLATGSQIAAEAQKQHPPLEASHPLSAFERYIAEA